MADGKTFSGKIVLITGSGRGIGRAIALHFAHLGADVIINYFRHREPAEQVAEQITAIGCKSIVVKANIGDMTQLQKLFAIAEGEFGYLHFFIHNAASGYNRPVLEQKPKGWDWTMNINARSLLFGAQFAAPLMEKVGGGAIVSISSTGSTRVLPDYVVVGASKAAIESVTRYLAVELAPKNIVVNAISPGVVLTDALQFFSSIRSNEDIVERALAHTPAGRLLKAKEVAEITAFLCSPAAYMIRGQVIYVDGGATLLGPGVINFPEKSTK